LNDFQARGPKSLESMTTSEALKTTFRSIFKTQRSGNAMKKIVLTFGLISGAIAAGMMFVTIPLIGRIPFEYLTVLGYTTFVAAFMMVFFGIRSYRDNVTGGTITFGRAFKVGILITLISCAIYVVTWEFVYHRFLPDFLDQYSNYMVEKMRAQGATQEALNQTTQEYAQFKEWYKNPFLRYAMTMMEAFPVGLLITLISALILRRKQPKRDGESGNPEVASVTG
jgi:Protein of unknown function (DUF4199)